MNNRPGYEGVFILNYLNNIEQQNHIIINVLETLNRQNLASRQLINSYINPFAPRYRDNTFNRNWNSTLRSPPPRNTRYGNPINTSIFSNSSLPYRNSGNTRHRQNTRNRQNTRSRRNTNQNVDNLNSFFTSRGRPFSFGATGANTQTNTVGTQSTNNESNTFLQTLLSILSPVRVYPTPEEIERATTTFTFNSEDDTLPRRICPIDREVIRNGDEVMRIRHCGHLFRRSSLSTWFDANTRCPLCRFDIREHSSPVSNTNTDTNTTESTTNTETTSNNSSETTPSTTPESNQNTSVPLTHDTTTTFLRDISGSTFNIDENAENFFSNVINNFSSGGRNTIDSINLDISGNTASLVLEGFLPVNINANRSNNNNNNSSDSTTRDVNSDDDLEF